ncbi:MAG: hypothetical protein AAGG11_19725 [Pseudomonadota bacterium]
MSDRRHTLRLSTLLCALLIAGCGSELESLTDNELQDRVYECKGETSMSPGRAISCDNYERECQRRRKEGRFVC